MKIAVVNISGNVGKSSMVKHLLSHKLPNAEIISVESINDGLDENEANRMKGKHALTILENVLQADEIIVDIGSSNAEAFINIMKLSADSQELFDLFIVPTVSARKQLQDTFSTIRTLIDFGVETHRIRVLLNKVDDMSDIKTEFAALIAFHKKNPYFTLDLRAAIPDNQIYDLSRSAGGKSVAELAADETDYKLLIRETKDRSERAKIAERRTLSSLAKSHVQFYDQAWNALTAD